MWEDFPSLWVTLGYGGKYWSHENQPILVWSLREENANIFAHSQKILLRVIIFFSLSQGFIDVKASMRSLHPGFRDICKVSYVLPTVFFFFEVWIKIEALFPCSKCFRSNNQLWQKLFDLGDEYFTVGFLNADPVPNRALWHPAQSLRDRPRIAQTVFEIILMVFGGEMAHSPKVSLWNP